MLQFFTSQRKSIKLILSDSDIIKSHEISSVYCPIEEPLIANLLPRLIHIRKINFQSVDISSQNLSLLINGTQIDSINFRFQTLDEFHLEVLLGAATLKSLKFIYCDVSIRSFALFFRDLSSKLTQLKFHNKKFSRELFESIGNFCKRTTTMKQLEICSPDDDSDTKSDFGQMFELLAESNMKKFKLSEFNFNLKIAKSFKRFLKRSQLKELTLEMIGLVGVDYVKNLFTKTNLKKLSLKSHFCSETIHNIPHLKLPPTFCLNKFIQSFEIKSIDISDFRSGVILISDFLNLLISTKNSTLESFCFNGDDTPDSVLINFVRLTQVKKFVITGQFIRNCDLTESLCENKSINALFLNFDQLGDIGKIVQINQSLGFLHSPNTLLSDSELVNIGQKMVSNCTLIHVMFRESHPTIEQILKRNQRIKNFHNERLWIKCYQLIKDKSLIPSIINDQWIQIAKYHDSNWLKRLIITRQDEDDETYTRAKYVDLVMKKTLFWKYSSNEMDLNIV